MGGSFHPFDSGTPNFVPLCEFCLVLGVFKARVRGGEEDVDPAGEGLADDREVSDGGVPGTPRAGVKKNPPSRRGEGGWEAQDAFCEYREAVKGIET